MKNETRPASSLPSFAEFTALQFSRPGADVASNAPVHLRNATHALCFPKSPLATLKAWEAHDLLHAEPTCLKCRAAAGAEAAPPRPRKASKATTTPAATPEPVPSPEPATADPDAKAEADFERLAAFGPGVKLVNVVTGETFTTPGTPEPADDPKPPKGGKRAPKAPKAPKPAKESASKFAEKILRDEHENGEHDGGAASASCPECKAAAARRASATSSRPKDASDEFAPAVEETSSHAGHAIRFYPCASFDAYRVLPRLLWVNGKTFERGGFQPGTKTVSYRESFAAAA